MIGVIGPRDSVDLVIETAEAIELVEEVIGRAYSDVEETVTLARELDQYCRVIIFTGLAPLTLARREGGWRAVLEYLPHSTVDLYRTLVRVLAEHSGVIPRLSIDTIPADDVAQAFADIGLPAPAHVLPLEGPDGGIRRFGLLAEEHATLQRSREVEVALSCVKAVEADLTRQGLICYRIDHTRSAIREILQRSALASQLVRSEATQMAIALVETTADGKASDSIPHYAAQRLRLGIQTALVDFAEGLKGTLSALDDRTFVVHTTRGAVENALDRHRRGHVSHIEPQLMGATGVVGYGLGLSASEAEANARRALARAREDGVTRIVHPDGRAEKISDTDERQEIANTLAVGAEALGLGSLAFTRLLSALRRIDITDVTTQDFAAGYGVTQRSARRLLAHMEQAGVATELPATGGNGPGRPPKRYRIDLERLTEIGRGRDKR